MGGVLGSLPDLRVVGVVFVASVALSGLAWWRVACALRRRAYRVRPR